MDTKYGEIKQKYKIYQNANLVQFAGILLKMPGTSYVYLIPIYNKESSELTQWT